MQILTIVWVSLEFFYMTDNFCKIGQCSTVRFAPFPIDHKKNRFCELQLCDPDQWSDDPVESKLRVFANFEDQITHSMGDNLSPSFSFYPSLPTLKMPRPSLWRSARFSASGLASVWTALARPIYTQPRIYSVQAHHCNRRNSTLSLWEHSLLDFGISARETGNRKAPWTRGRAALVTTTIVSKHISCTGCIMILLIVCYETISNGMT